MITHMSVTQWISKNRDLIGKELIEKYAEKMILAGIETVFNKQGKPNEELDLYSEVLIIREHDQIGKPMNKYYVPEDQYREVQAIKEGIENRKEELIEKAALISGLERPALVRYFL